MPTTAPANVIRPWSEADPLGLDRNEAESPRGRIARTRAFADGALLPDATIPVQHPQEFLATHLVEKPA